MKTKFRGYYRIHRSDLLERFADCLFVFDASALLDIFRLNKDLTEQVFKVMEHYSEQIRVPYHAAEEYNERINSVLEGQYNKIEEAKKNFERFEQSLNAKRNQPYISTKTSKLIQSLKKQIEIDFDEQAEYIMDELIHGNLQNRMADLLDAKVLEPFSEEEIQRLKENGKKRYADRIPPGWKDTSKQANSYGDYINWEEILRLAESDNKSIVFITNEMKEDWIETVDGKKLGPLHALSQEFYDRIGNVNQLFYIYTLDGFLELVQEHDKILESPLETIGNVRNILERFAIIERGLNSKVQEFPKREVESCSDSKGYVEDKGGVKDEHKMAIDSDDGLKYDRESEKCVEA